MFGLGAGEIFLILVFALIFIGPKKLPELAQSLGKSLREFQKAKDDLMAQVHEEANEMKKDISSTNNSTNSEDESHKIAATIGHIDSEEDHELEEFPEFDGVEHPGFDGALSQTEGQSEARPENQQETQEEHHSALTSDETSSEEDQNSVEGNKSSPKKDA